ncbi:MAG: efflux RND transporter periplasmic adaptor subunit [Deltaproteobacteria bacterium]|nr:efflux RND transporter periplasmic adaptor subunit [Deltaproteobacteria bacterium]
MKRLVTIIIALAVGAGFGGAVVLLYGRTTPPKAGIMAKKERRILYYRNPMKPGVTSPVPMKDNMGMDYVPVYEDEAASQTTPGTVRISPEKIQKIGVKSEEAARRRLRRVIRTVGRVEPVEDNIFVINAKVGGWVEKLYVSRTDQMVSPGDRLLDIYSPDLVSAQEEYLLAQKSFTGVKSSPYPEIRRGAESLLEAARKRLRNWDISDDQIERLKETGRPGRVMTIKAPAMGSVTEKMVVEGQKINPGETLFKIIDHSKVWVYGEIYEYELPYIKTGGAALVTLPYSSGEAYTGAIDHVYTHLGSIRYEQDSGTEVRTAKVRIELPNKDQRLKLGMYLNIDMPVEEAASAVAVPEGAVIDTGVRRMLIIDRRDGTFEPREVKAGAKADGYYEIKSGVAPGEWVVTSASFLIDSESNLKAAISGMGAGTGEDRDGPSAPATEGGAGAHAGH